MHRDFHCTQSGHNSTFRCNLCHGEGRDFGTYLPVNIHLFNMLRLVRLSHVCAALITYAYRLVCIIRIPMFFKGKKHKQIQIKCKNPMPFLDHSFEWCHCFSVICVLYAENGG
jgi:hypothetical protein